MNSHKLNSTFLSILLLYIYEKKYSLKIKQFIDPFLLKICFYKQILNLLMFIGTFLTVLYLRFMVN